MKAMIPIQDEHFRYFYDKEIIIYLRILTLLPADSAMISAQLTSKLDIHAPQLLDFSGVL
jgi:hypothetical protein